MIREAAQFFVIDDDEDDREFFCTAIQSIDSGIECIFAISGVHAIEKLQAEPAFNPDFIFIDMNMPLMSGTQCLQMIKTIERLSDVPAYIYSTAGSPNVISEALEAGAKEFLIKPSSMQAMTEMLRGILQPL